MKTKDLKDIALEYELEVIATTKDRGCYSRDIKEVIIGFDDFQQAEKLAKKYGLSIELFHKEDGNPSYYRTGFRKCEEITVSADNFGDDYTSFKKNDYEKAIAPMLSDFESLEELDEFLYNQRKIMYKLCIADVDEIVICRDHCYYDTVKEKTMKFYNDGLVTVIGLIDRHKRKEIRI